jgi:hypothetical protein
VPWEMRSWAQDNGVGGAIQGLSCYSSSECYFAAWSQHSDPEWDYVDNFEIDPRRARARSGRCLWASSRVADETVA